MSEDLVLEGLSAAENAILNARFRAMEQEIAGKVPSNPYATASRSAGNVAMPAPANLARSANVNTINLTWSPVASDALLYYEVEISGSDAFDSLIGGGAYQVPPQQPFFTFQEGDPGQTYYARVRAFGRGLAPSAYSETVNTETGLATSSNLAIATATNPFESTIEMFSPRGVATNGHGGRPSVARYRFPETQETIGGILVPFVVFEFTYASRATPVGSGDRGAQLNTRFFVNGIRQDDTPFEFPSNIGGVTTDPDAPAAATGLATPLSAYVHGDTHFDVEIEVRNLIGGSEDAIVDPTKLRIECLELRR